MRLAYIDANAGISGNMFLGGIVGTRGAFRLVK